MRRGGSRRATLAPSGWRALAAAVPGKARPASTALPSGAQAAEVAAQAADQVHRCTQGCLAERAACRGTWIAARNAAILTLLYGLSIVLRRALGLKGADLRANRSCVSSARATRPVLCRSCLWRHKRWTNIGSSAPTICPPPEALFRGATKSRNRPARNGEAAFGAEPADTATPHALRHSFATHFVGAWRRPADDPGGCSAMPACSTTQIYTGVDAARLLDVYEQAHPRA